jgi:hypothetical protein
MQRRKTALSVVAAAAVLSLVAAACGGGGGTAATTAPSSATTTGPAITIKDGGVYRSAIEDFGFTGAFDPTGEYLGTAFGLFSQLLMRNLVT